MELLIAFGLPVLVALIGLPLLLGLVPPGGRPGLRTATTGASISRWYLVNRVFGLSLAIAGGASALANALILDRLYWSSPLRHDPETIFARFRWLGISLLAALALCLTATFVFDRLLRPRNDLPIDEVDSAARDFVGLMKRRNAIERKSQAEALRRYQQKK